MVTVLQPGSGGRWGDLDLVMEYSKCYTDLRIAHASRCMVLDAQEAEGKISPLDGKDEIHQNLLCSDHN